MGELETLVDKLDLIEFEGVDLVKENKDVQLTVDINRYTHEEIINAISQFCNKKFGDNNLFISEISKKMNSFYCWLAPKEKLEEARTELAEKARGKKSSSVDLKTVEMPVFLGNLEIMAPNIFKKLKIIEISVVRSDTLTATVHFQNHEHTLRFFEYARENEKIYPGILLTREGSSMEENIAHLLAEIGVQRIRTFTPDLFYVDERLNRSPVYYDIRRVKAFPNVNEIILAYAVITLSHIKYDYLVGPSISAIPLLSDLSTRLHKDMCWLRINKNINTIKLEGMQPYQIKGKTGFFIDDVIAQGRVAARCLRFLEQYGTNIEQGLVILDRMEGGKENLLFAGVNLISLTTSERMLSPIDIEVITDDSKPKPKRSKDYINEGLNRLAIISEYFKDRAGFHKRRDLPYSPLKR